MTTQYLDGAWGLRKERAMEVAVSDDPSDAAVGEPLIVGPRPVSRNTIRSTYKYIPRHARQTPCLSRARSDQTDSHHVQFPDSPTAVAASRPGGLITVLAIPHVTRLRAGCERHASAPMAITSKWMTFLRSAQRSFWHEGQGYAPSLETGEQATAQFTVSCRDDADASFSFMRPAIGMTAPGLRSSLMSLPRLSIGSARPI